MSHQTNRCQIRMLFGMGLANPFFVGVESILHVCLFPKRYVEGAQKRSII